MIAGPQGRGQFLDDGQRHHFAADFGKTLDPAPNGQVAVRVDRHHVTGVVPTRPKTGNRRLQHARLTRVQITQHDVWPLDVQFAAFADALYRFQLTGQSRHWPPHRTGPVLNRRIDRHDGGGFGRAVPFQNAYSEFVQPQATGILL